MKKLFATLVFVFLIPIFTGCEISNTELANALEGNMTRLVYSIGYLDSISTEELSRVVNDSSYFTHSSLYTATESENPTVQNELNSGLETATNESGLLDGDANITNQLVNGGLGVNTTTNTIGVLNGGLATQTEALGSGRTAFQEVAYRSNTYSSPLTKTASTLTGGYNAGVVDMTLLETSAADLNNILIEISGKRGIIMLYCTDLRSGRATLSNEDKEAISIYNDIIKETTNYLNNNTGILTTHFNGISSISANENSAELINAKLIRANEVLKTRYAKLDSCLDSLNAVINILVNSIGYDYANLYNNSLTTLPNTTTDVPINLPATENITTNPTSTITNPTTTTVTNPTTTTINPTSTITNPNCPCDNTPDTIINYNNYDSYKNKNALNPTTSITTDNNSRTILDGGLDNNIPLSVDESPVGKIMLLPFVYEEDNIIKRIPKQ